MAASCFVVVPILFPIQQKEYTYGMKFTSIAVFVLFFGLALIEALQRGKIG